MDEMAKLEQEFERIFKDYWAELVIFAKQIVGNGEAEDLVQQVMKKIWIRIQYETILNPRAWLYRVLYNECNNFLRTKKKRKIGRGNENRFDEITEKEDSQWKDPIETMIQFEQLEQINGRVTGFSNLERQVFYFTYQCPQPFTIEEIAQVLCTSKQTISATKTRLLSKLKDIFQDEDSQ